jgi:hypothetical protein
MQKTIRDLKKLIAQVKQLDPQPESNAPLEQSESGRAYQALTLLENALSWLQPPPGDGA